MAVYRLSAQVIGRNSGRSVTGAAAYRAACRIEDERTGLVHDYTRKSGVPHSEILAPENVPDWMRDRVKLWNAVERGEKRKDAQLCREILLNLPHELTTGQQRELVRAFVRDQCVARGMVADIAIHAAHREGDDRNIHAHVMLTMREAKADGFGQKARDWNSPELLAQWREQWALYQNRALERAGRSERVDHRSLEARGIDREPEPKQGPVATQMERHGRPSKAGDDRRAVKARNAERDEIKAEAKIIDLRLERLKREEQQRKADTGRQREREIDRAKGRFEREANASRAEQQNRRFEQTGEQQRRHAVERLDLQSQQQKTYGAQLKALRKEAAAIAGRQQKAKGWRGLAYRATGWKERDEVRRAEIKAGVASIEQRKAEQVQALGIRQQQEKTALDRHHAEQERRLEARIAQDYQRRGIDAEAEKTPVEGREIGTGKTTPEQTQATHGPREAAQEGNSGQEPEWKKAGWASAEEREAAIRAIEEQWGQQARIQRDPDRHRFGVSEGRSGHDEGRSRSR